MNLIMRVKKRLTVSMCLYPCYTGFNEAWLILRTEKLQLQCCPDRSVTTSCWTKPAPFLRTQSNSMSMTRTIYEVHEFSPNSDWWNILPLFKVKYGTLATVIPRLTFTKIWFQKDSKVARVHTLSLKSFDPAFSYDWWGLSTRWREPEAKIA